MAGNDYEKFFKDARKAAQQGKGPQPTSKSNSKLGSIIGKMDQQKTGSMNGQKKGSKRTGTPEERLRQELTQRMNVRNQRVRRERKFPVFAAICAVVALVSCGFGYYKYDLADRLITKALSHIDIGVFGQASAAEDTTKTPAKTDATGEKSASPADPKKEKAAETATTAKSSAAPSVKQWTPEELSFFSKLNDRKHELDMREAELNKLEEELQKRKTELDEKLNQLEATRTEISKTLKTRVASDQTKVDKLVQLYSSMKPQQAAKIMESENEDLAVELLDKMKKKSAAEILDMMDTKKARRLSELLTGYQRSPASSDKE
jgi:flagellar motility protein MotE (MotC chaperone)